MKKYYIAIASFIIALFMSGCAVFNTGRTSNEAGSVTDTQTAKMSAGTIGNSGSNGSGADGSEAKSETAAEADADEVAEADENVTEPGENPASEQNEAQTAEPTEEPTVETTEEPAKEPTAEPAKEPTAETAKEPTAEPAEEPTEEPAGNVSGASNAEQSTTVSAGGFTVTTDDGSVSQSGTTFTISAAGTYVLTGTLTDGRVVVDAPEDAEIELDLSNASITCSYDSPIYVKSAGKVKIKSLEGTKNYVNDTRALQTNEADTTGAAAIYALCDLDVVGKGALTVTATYNNGIHTKDDLEIKNVTLTVTAPNNALKGNDSVTIESGTLTLISTRGDGIKTENSDVSSKGNRRGIITVNGGTVTIYSACDGIDASYDVVISGTPVITINTHAYSEYTASDCKKTTSTKGVKKSADSAKGIKADNQITISGGAIVINAMDDGIHANTDVALADKSTPLGNITITGGSITITAADDGIHADGTLQIDGGYVNVLNSHEGLEGHYVNVNGGEIYVYATDDGVNATSSNGRSSDGLITVTGGKMVVEVAGRDVDGIDSNGSYKQTGGFVVVSNPAADSSGNMSAVDADGQVSVTGGIIIALGTVPGNGGGAGGGRGGRFGMGGMTSSSSLPSGYVTLSGTLSAGTHTFTFGSTTETFTLKASVSSGWIWASGISSSNYSLK